LALQIVRQLIQLNPNATIIILDWKADHRALYHLLPSHLLKNFYFFSLDNANVAPFYYNPLRPPVVRYGDEHTRIVVDPENWCVELAELYSDAWVGYARPVALFEYILTELYNERQVFDRHGERGFTNYPTLADMYRYVVDHKQDLLEQKSRLHFQIESLDSMESRLYRFTKGKLREMFSNPNKRAGIPIEHLVKPGQITVMECNVMQDGMKKFIYGSIADAIFNYLQMLNASGSPRDRHTSPVFLVLEEAHQLLQKSVTQKAQEELHKKETSWEKMFREGLGQGLICAAICQIPSKLPTSIHGNTPIKFVFRLSETMDKDAELMTSQLLRDPRWDNRPFKRFLGKQLVGQCVAQLSTDQIWGSEPIALQVSGLGNVPHPTLQELKTFMQPKIAQLLS
jgi:hypothetical protein